MKFFIPSLILAVILESTITTLPLVLLMILFLAVIKRSNEVFLTAFLAGLFLDLLSFGRFGLSSLYFTIFVFVIYVYQNKFEIETLHFITIFSFFGSLFYLITQGSQFIFLQSVVATIISVSSFMMHKKFNKKIPKYA